MTSDELMEVSKAYREMQKENPAGGYLTLPKDGKVFSAYFGVTCAFAALGMLVARTNLPKINAEKNELTKPSLVTRTKFRKTDEAENEVRKPWQTEKIQLLERIKEAEAEVAEMKKRRAEDAKANEKVVAIFCTQRQYWKTEKKKLKQQVEILLKQSQALMSSEEKICAECVRKAELLSDLDVKSAQIEAELVDALNQLESCKKECKIISEEKKEVTEKLTSEVVKLQKDIDEKEEVICSMLRKSEEKQELERELIMVEAKRKQGDWTGLEKSLHAAHIKQRHWQEVDAFERQMRAKDERMEAFRRKLLSMENQSRELQTQNGDLFRSLEQAKKKNASLEELLKEKDLVFNSLKERMILQEKSRAFSRNEHVSQNNSQGIEVEAAKNKLKRKELKAAISRDVEDSEAEFERNDFKFPVLEADLFQLQMHYEEEEKGAERICSRITRGRPVSKNYLRGPIGSSEHRPFGRNAKETSAENMCGARDEFLRMENPHLKYLIEQATQAFNSSFQVGSLKGMLQSAEENVKKSKLRTLPQTYERDGDILASERERHEEQPTIVDKHVSETRKSCDDNEHQAEGKVVVPVKLRSRLGSFSDWQNGKSTTSLVSDPQVCVSWHSGIPKGKIVSHNHYLTHKKMERLIDEVSDKETQTQTIEQDSIHAETVPVKNFVARKNDDLSCDTSSYLKHMLEGRDSSRKNDIKALAVSSQVKRLEQQLLQLEKMSTTEVSERTNSKDHKLSGNVNIAKGNEKEQVQSNSTPVSAIHLLKKQVKRYQALVEKIDDLCKRMHDKDPVQTITSALHSRTREEIAEQELFLIETFQLQQYVVATGKKLMAIQSEIACNSCAMNNELAGPAKSNMRQSIETAKNHLKEIQRSLEIRLARIIGDLEGILARNGILHVMPVEWKKEHKTKVGKSKPHLNSQS